MWMVRLFACGLAPRASLPCPLGFSGNGKQRYLGKSQGSSGKTTHGQARQFCSGALSPRSGGYTLASVETVILSIQKILLWAIPILVAVVLHELAHGYVAFRLGDPTAARAGRLTLNPIAHLDLFGSILLPVMLLLAGAPFLFGYAKPVPVDCRNLRNPRRDMVFVAAAGPLTNILLAALSALGFKWILSLPAPGGGVVPIGLAMLALMLQYSVLMNVGLAVFNLLPVPPLDGGRVATGLLPRLPALALARLEPYGLLIVMALLMTGVLNHFLRPVTVLLLHTLL